MSIAHEDKILDEQIRDTEECVSDIAESRGYIGKTIVVLNTLNQSITMQCQGSIDEAFDSPIDIDDPFVVNANVNTYHNCTACFPFLRVTTICETAPTSGDLIVWLAKITY